MEHYSKLKPEHLASELYEKGSECFRIESHYEIEIHLTTLINGKSNLQQQVTEDVTAFTM